MPKTEIIKSLRPNPDFSLFRKTDPNKEMSTMPLARGNSPATVLDKKPTGIINVAENLQSRLLRNIQADAVNAANEALADVPRARKIDIRQINTTLTLEQIREKEKKEQARKPRYLHDAFIDSGVSVEFTEMLSLNISNVADIPTYWDKQTKQIFIAKDVIEKILQIPNGGACLKLLLGIDLTGVILQHLPTPRELKKEDWKEIAINFIDAIFQEIANSRRQQANSNFENVNIQKLNDHRKNIINMLDHEDTHFIAVGAEIHVVFPGQNLENSDVAIGINLNRYIIEELLTPLTTKLLKKLVNVNDNGEDLLRDEMENSRKRNMQILKALLPDNTIPKSAILLNLFSESKIPQLFMDYRNNRIGLLTDIVNQDVQTHKKRQHRTENNIANHRADKWIEIALASLDQSNNDPSEEPVNPNLYPE